MIINQIERAVDEAHRFIRAAEDALQRDTDIRNASGYQRKTYSSVESTRESGTLRRASMDLTRALADMRKP